MNGRALWRSALLLAALALTLLPARFPAAAPPERFSASYEFRHKGLLLARMERTLKPGGDGTFVLESRSTPAGIFAAMLRDRIRESSVWEYADGRPRPLKYQYHHTGRGEGRHVTLDFNWQKGTVITSVNNSPWSMKVPADVQDKLLYQFTLMLDAADPQASLEYPVADGGELKTYRFERLGEERLKTALGRLQTVKLRRVGGKTRTTVWCAPAYGFMPVRLEQDKDGRVLVVTATRIRID
jgi:hypothetical protein